MSLKGTTYKRCGCKDPRTGKPLTSIARTCRSDGTARGCSIRESGQPKWPRAG